VACAARGLVDEADSLFQAAIALADDEPKTLLDYAEMLRATERHDEAERILAQVEPGNPAQTERLMNLKLWKLRDNSASPTPPGGTRRAPAEVARLRPGLQRA
jgi:thioredoxin-like negative regulator of GroEL